MARTLVGVLVLGMCAVAAGAPRVSYRGDGSVEVGGARYASPAAWHESAAFRESGARCGSIEPPPALFAAPGDCTLSSTSIQPEYSDNRELVVQVVWHVIQRDDGMGALTPALIQSQMDVLDEDFNALAGTAGAMGTNARVRFVMARWAPDGTPTTGINVVVNNLFFEDVGSNAPTNPMKQALAWDPVRYLNIYTNDAAGLLGYAVFPQTEKRDTKEDGVVMLWSAVGRNGATGGNYNLGRTATHEVGHYLGLVHTFQGGCGNAAQP